MPELGSPPHTRGRFINASFQFRFQGFTPAYAGKMVPVVTHALTAWVHPRIRGEDTGFFLMPGASSGSPPHTRGRSGQLRALQALGRFTPAYAGKMQALSMASIASRVHPRIRGEDNPRLDNFGNAPGSPPHTRGRLGMMMAGAAVLGFTPAYAGKICT